MEHLKFDVRHAIRLFYKMPGFTLIVLLTLTLSIGANAAMFSLVEAVLLKDPPYPNSDRVVFVWERGDKDNTMEYPASAPNFLDWRSQNSAFDKMAALDTDEVNFTDGQSPERLRRALVSPDLFSVLGTQPALGITFQGDEKASDNPRVVLLSHGLWQRKFAGSTGVIGQNLRLDGESYTVMGVMPKGFAFPQGVDLWVPLTFGRAALPEERGAHGYTAVARMKPGVSLAQAQTEMNVISKRLADEYPNTNTGSGTKLVPLHQQLVGDTKTPLLLLFGAVAFVLLIACLNVANLLFARSASRRKELAIRVALGARRGRLVRQFLTESLLLSCVAGGLGFLLALWATNLAVLLLPAGVQLTEGNEIGVSPLALLFTIGISILSGVIFGIAPALSASQVNLNQSLQESSRGMSEGRRLRGFRNFLTVAQVALSLVLLVGAALLLKSFMRLQSENIGFEPAGVLTMNVALTSNRYQEPPTRVTTYRQLVERIGGVSGVKSAGLISRLPLEAGMAALNSFEIEGRPTTSIQQDLPVAFERRASVDYFKTMSIPVVRGRLFTERDGLDAPLVAVIDESAVRRYWPNEDPLGRHIYYTRRGKRLAVEIVGIVGPVKQNQLEVNMGPTVYLPLDQNPRNTMTMVVRTSVSPKNLAETIAREVRAVDPDLPVSNVRTMEDVAAETSWRLRFAMSLLGAFSVIALGLAALGIYGVLSYNVTQRTREMAIRMALGARQVEIFRIIVGKSLVLVLAGLTAGALAAVVFSRFLSGLLYEVSALDMVTYIGVSAVLLVIGLLAALIPARRAMRIDPALTLRPE
jgi:putative ABC transport system permease protein